MHHRQPLLLLLAAAMCAALSPTVIHAQMRILSGGPIEHRGSVTYWAAKGKQYRLQGIQFTGSELFPTCYLRNQFALQNGDPFDLREIKKGIELLTKIFGSQGYINFTAEPELRPDNDHQRILVVMHLGEERQFRVGSVVFLGLAPEISGRAVKIGLKPGEIFNSELVEEFYKENRAVLPIGASAKHNTRVTQDAKTGTVAVVFDFSACP